MNYNNFGRKMSFIQFNFLNVKGNWAHLAEKNSRPGAKITTILRLIWKCLNYIIIKTF